ncbi:hypothetical protein HPP92_000221 [Vanilla planifolia]|uniref:Pentatricopeptide repeat-containing protein n=1 Tax=Vanilla planifolia TaxID=51239 RepID=A0A835RXN3_VANPL|nr:hypothetical protein HPP92_000221 [Vanilla planifolia]
MLLSSGCRLVLNNLSAILPFFLCASILSRHLGFACHSLVDSDTSSSEEFELELDFSPPQRRKLSSPIINRVGYPACELKAGNSYERKYSYDRIWCSKETLMRRIVVALLKQGWDLSFHASFGIDLDSCSFHRMLNDLFDESSDAALVYYLFRMWRRCDDKAENKLLIECTMIHIAVAGNMNYIAVDLLRGIVRSNPTVEVGLNLIFHELWQTRRDRGGLEAVYSMLVLSFAKEGMLHTASKLMIIMEKFGFYPSHGVYIAIGILLKEELSRKFGLDKELFVEMQSWGAQLIGLSLSLLIKEFCDFGCLESACKLLYDIPKFGGEVDHVAYTILIDAFCKRSLMKEATSFLFKMAQKGLSPDCTLIASVVDGYCKNGRLEDALNLLKYLSFVPDSFMYNSFISKFCQEGEVEHANALLSMMSELGVAPDSVNFTTVIDGYCRACQIIQALKVFGQMLKRGIEPNTVTYTVLIWGYCNCEDIQGAELVFNALKGEGFLPDVVMCNILINAYSKRGAMNMVDELVDMMKKFGLSPDSRTYNLIMHCLLKRGIPVEAIFSELVRRGFVPEKIYSPDSTNKIYGFSGGLLEKAHLIWCSLGMQGLAPDVVTCSALLNWFCKAHHMKDADLLFQEMLDAGLEPDLIMYNMLIHGFCRVGDISKARDLLIMMKNSGIFPNSSTKYALVISLEKGREGDAQESAAKILQDIFS